MRRALAGLTAGVVLAASWPAAAAGAAEVVEPRFVVAGAGAAWSAAERAAVVAALARLPPALVTQPPREIVRGDVACLPDGLPADDAIVDRMVDRGGRLHLCAPSADAGRQAAAALLWAAGRVGAWSDLAAWRRLDRWSASLASLGRPRSANLADEGFAAPVARRSPRWDLAAFAAAYFLDGTGDADRGVACRLISQASFLRERLAAIGAPAVPAPPACPAFERWAALDDLADVELVLAAPSTAMVGSLFGHLFVRLVYRNGGGETPMHRSRTLAFLADNERPLQDDAGYALKGIFGFYTASLHERAFLDAYREYVVGEGRDLRRWRLALSPVGRRALLERLWTALHGTRYAYYFFRRNCATLMLDLVDDARPAAGAVAHPGLLAAPPASTLEAWAQARNEAGAPLLAFVPEPIFGFEHEARLASAARRAREPRLGAALGPAARQALAAARSVDPAARAAAYDRLAAPLHQAPVAAAGDVQAWLHESAIVESHLSALANRLAEARAFDERRRRLREVTAALAAELGGGPAPAALKAAVAELRATDGARRLRAYGQLRTLVPAADAPIADRTRRLALLTSEMEYDVAAMKTVPGLRQDLFFVDRARPLDEQPYLAAGHADLIHVPVETRVAAPLLALQRAARAARGPHDDDGAHNDDGDGDDDDEREAAGEAARAAEIAASAARAYDASQSRSGIDQLAVLAGLAAPPAGGHAPEVGLVLAGALYDERVGDHRRFGFPGDTAFVVARNRAFVTAGPGGAGVARWDTRLVGYRSVRAPLPETAGHTRALGWEMYLDVGGDRPRAIAAEAQAGWGLLVPLHDGDDLADHLLAAVGLAAASRFPSASAPPGAGVRHALSAPVALELRAGVGAAPGYRSWIAARLFAAPTLVLAGAPLALAVEIGASAEAHLALRGHAASGARDPALLLGAELARRPAAGGVASTAALLTAGLELR